MKHLIRGVVIAAACANPAVAANDYKAGDMMIRARALGVVPQESSSLSIGGSVNVDNSVVPELDFTYFFTPNVSAEVVAGVTPHNVRTKSGVDAGSAWLLPPTVTLQYHFTQFDSVKPYVGAGVNYTHFFNEDAGALNSVKYDDSFGGALQAGVNIPIKDNWYANVDVKKYSSAPPQNSSLAASARMWISTLG